MEEVTVYYENTKDFEERGNKQLGANLAIHSPYETGFGVIYETESNDGENWRKEFELGVQDKVWFEEFRWGDSLERRSEEYFIHKDVLERNLSEEEKKFLNPYRSRFLLIRDEGKLYIFNLETKRIYLQDKQIKDFRNFKAQLKKLHLI